MIRIVKIDRSGISHAIEYDKIDEKRFVFSMIGVVESLQLKLPKRSRWDTRTWGERHSDIIHYMNSNESEIGHSMLKLVGSPYSIAVFDAPRIWGLDKDEYTKVDYRKFLKRDEELSVSLAEVLVG